MLVHKLSTFVIGDTYMEFQSMTGAIGMQWNSSGISDFVTLKVGFSSLHLFVWSGIFCVDTSAPKLVVGLFVQIVCCLI